MNKKIIKTTVDDMARTALFAHKRRKLYRAWRDPRRLAIANQFPLSAEQKEQVDALYVTYYGRKIDYVWHQNYAAHAGHFDYRFFPEILFIPEFEAYQNWNKSYIAAFSDKNLLPVIAGSAGVSMPRTIVSCTNGQLRDGENHCISPQMARELMSREGDCFVKPAVDSNSGRGCIILKEGDEFVFSHNSMSYHKVGGGEGVYANDFVIQQLIVCHDSIRQLYAGSVNTFRIITYLWRGHVEVMPLIIRIGQGDNYLDNAHLGGLFCGVHYDGRLCDHAVTEFNCQYTEHPNTRVSFSGHRISFVKQAVEAAKTIHSAIPQLGVVNWDFTIDSEGGPVLIEANCKNGSIWLPQMAHGIGPFGERIIEVLQWLRFMKKLKPHDRLKYVNGYME